MNFEPKMCYFVFFTLLNITVAATAISFIIMFPTNYFGFWAGISLLVVQAIVVFTNYFEERARRHWVATHTAVDRNSAVKPQRPIYKPLISLPVKKEKEMDEERQEPDDATCVQLTMEQDPQEQHQQKF